MNVSTLVFSVPLLAAKLQQFLPAGTFLDYFYCLGVFVSFETKSFGAILSKIGNKEGKIKGKEI